MTAPTRPTSQIKQGIALKPTGLTSQPFNMTFHTKKRNVAGCGRKISVSDIILSCTLHFELLENVKGKKE